MSKVKVIDYWSNEDGDLVILTKDNKEYTLVNPWWKSISFGELDYGPTEECTIELSIRYDE
jgi:hypothetical protein